MRRLYWVGHNAQRQVLRGCLTVDSRLSAKLQLSQLHIRLKTLSPYPPLYFMHSIKSDDVTQFLSQCSVLLNAGIPLVKALHLLAQQYKNTPMRSIIFSIAHQLTFGVSLSECFIQYPAFSDGMMASLINIGERTGKLAIIMQHLVIYRQQRAQYRQQFKQAMAYPCLLVTMGFLVSVTMLGWVLPQFQQLFHDMHATLPVWTVWVMKMSQCLRQYAIEWMIGAVFLLGLGVCGYHTQPPVKYCCHLVLLNFPIWKTVYQPLQLLRLSNTIKLLLQSGIPLMDALMLTEKSVPNVIYQQNLHIIRHRTTQGQSLTQALQAIKSWPDFFKQMLSIGESSVSIEEMLDNVSKYYSNQIQVNFQYLSTFLEPVMMCLLAGTLGGLVLAIYLPIFQLGMIF